MLSNIPEVVSKTCYILQINSEFRNVFDNKPKIAFKTNKNRQGLIGGSSINNGKTTSKNRTTTR